VEFVKIEVQLNGLVKGIRYLSEEKETFWQVIKPVTPVNQ